MLNGNAEPAAKPSVDRSTASSWGPGWPGAATKRVQDAWFLRFRGPAVLAQTVVAAVAIFGAHVALPAQTIGAVILVEVAGNYVLWSVTRELRPVSATMLFAMLVFDGFLLALLLISTGGPLNPCACLFLVPVALGAALLPRSMTWSLLAWLLVCFGLLFFQPRWWQPPVGLNHLTHGPSQMQRHMCAMWCAFAATSCFISTVVTCVRQRLIERELELMRARALAAQSAQLVSVTSLVTGAAHELSTPLSTIAVVAKELERVLVGSETRSDDVRSIRVEVARCREILQRMIAAASSTDSCSRVRITFGSLLRDAIEASARVDRIALCIDARSDGLTLYAPAQAVSRALRSVLDHTLEAAGERPIEVEARVESDCCWIAVRDFGSGVNREPSARAGERFISTEAPDRADGLGVYCARIMVERAGGQLSLESRRGGGTLALLTIPLGDQSDSSSM